MIFTTYSKFFNEEKNIDYRWFLADYKCYRKRKGGIWFKIRVNMYWTYWTEDPENSRAVKNKENPTVDILETEDYTYTLPSSTG